MAVKPRANVPDDLTFLLPEEVAVPILIGSDAYDLYPLTEGEFEKLSMEVSKLFEVVFIKGEKSPVEFLMSGDTLINILCVALKPLEAENIRSSLTAKQMMYVASILWKMNFETHEFSEETKENFTKVLGWVGLGTAKSPTAPKTAPKKETVTEEKSAGGSKQVQKKK